MGPKLNSNNTDEMSGTLVGLAVVGELVGESLGAVVGRTDGENVVPS